MGSSGLEVTGVNIIKVDRLPRSFDQENSNLVSKQKYDTQLKQLKFSEVEIWEGLEVADGSL